MLPFRLMPIAEAIDFHRIAQCEGWTESGVRVFWSDDNSNYAGFYVTGPLRGRLCYIDHEETDLSPVYRSLRSFLEAMLAAMDEGCDWPDLPTDYPAYRPTAKPEEAQHDWAAAQALRPLLEGAEDDRERQYAAFCIMALAPFEQTEALLGFLWDDDMWVQERCCAILGRRKYDPAVPQLAEVAIRGGHNGRGAAIKALGAIASEASLAQLLQLIGKLPPGYAGYLGRALQGCGCEVSHSGG